VQRGHTGVNQSLMAPAAFGLTAWITSSRAKTRSMPAGAVGIHTPVALDAAHSARSTAKMATAPTPTCAPCLTSDARDVPPASDEAAIEGAHCLGAHLPRCRSGRSALPSGLPLSPARGSAPQTPARDGRGETRGRAGPRGRTTAAGGANAAAPIAPMASARPRRAVTGIPRRAGGRATKKKKAPAGIFATRLLDQVQCVPN